MRFQVTFKTPDSLENTVDEETEYELSTLEDEFQDDENREEIKAKLMKFASKWVKWSEYITVEFDLEAETCKVLEV